MKRDEKKAKAHIHAKIQTKAAETLFSVTVTTEPVVDAVNFWASYLKYRCCADTNRTGWSKPESLLQHLSD